MLVQGPESQSSEFVSVRISAMVQILYCSLLKHAYTLEIWGQHRSAALQHLQQACKKCKKWLCPRSNSTSHRAGKEVLPAAIPSRDQNCSASALDRDLWQKRTTNIPFSHVKLGSSKQLCIWEAISCFPFILTFCILPVWHLLCSFLRGLHLLDCNSCSAGQESSSSSFLL